MYIAGAAGNAGHMSWPSEDPSFVSSVERHYLAEIGRDRELVTADAHRSRLAAAIYAADRTNGGLRFRHLDERIRTDLERRLRRARPPI
jgi:hypothetical protein